MPELKYFSIICHIPGLGLRKGSSALPLAIPHATKTCINKFGNPLLKCIPIIFNCNKEINFITYLRNDRGYS